MICCKNHQSSFVLFPLKRNNFMAQSWDYPTLLGGMLVRDEYDGVHAYIVQGSKQVRYKILGLTDEVMRARMAEDDQPFEEGDQIALEAATIPAANHVLEEDRPREINRIRKA